MATRTIEVSGDGLAEAVADTEAEIFAEATGTEPLENTGDRSLEEQGEGLEGEHVEDESDAEPEADEQDQGEQVEDEGEPARDEKTGQFTKADSRVPRDRLNQESEKRRLAEAERDATKAEIAALNAKIEALTQRPQNPQPQKQEQQPQDFWENPEQAIQRLVSAETRKVEARLVEGSFHEAAQTHGDKFKEAYSELFQVGGAESQQYGASQTVRNIWTSPNPGRALMDWHNQRATAREVGNDPNAWLEKRLAERLADPEFLAKAVDAARVNAGQGDQGRPRTATRLPPSLNSATGRGSHQDRDPDLYDNSEKSVFDFATR